MQTTQWLSCWLSGPTPGSLYSTSQVYSVTARGIDQNWSLLPRRACLLMKRLAEVDGLTSWQWCTGVKWVAAVPRFSSQVLHPIIKPSFNRRSEVCVTKKKSWATNAGRTEVFLIASRHPESKLCCPETAFVDRTSGPLVVKVRTRLVPVSSDHQISQRAASATRPVHLAKIVPPRHPFYYQCRSRFSLVKATANQIYYTAINKRTLARL